MFGTSWISSVRALVGGSHCRRAVRTHHRPCLGLESLEAREVLGGGVTLGYALTGGNLYHAVAFS